MSCAGVQRDALLPGAIHMMDRSARHLPSGETRTQLTMGGCCMANDVYGTDAAGILIKYKTLLVSWVILDI
jgi:hypothetical protein